MPRLPNPAEFVAVIGTGVSMGLTDNKIPALSWKGLIRNGFEYAVTKGKITPAQAEAWKPQLDSNDLDDLLSAADFTGQKLKRPPADLYARWLESVFKHVEPSNKPMEEALRAVHAAGVPLCTLNYDGLLERVTGLPTINLTETVKAAEWMRRESQGILHLHGSWDAPATCILGIRDYETTLRNDVRDLIQRTLSSFKRLLFIGCGDTFADPNFSALIHWLKDNMKTAAPEHYALVIEGDMKARHADSSWQGFVEPVSYGASRSDLAAFLLANFPPATAKPKPPKPSATSEHARLIGDYRAFLLKDCGQLTIEGVSADMDTAQRKFDLERLFVPLELLPSPPEIPATDLEREHKLLQWQEQNKEPVQFGEVFTKHRHLALLALPGGGKSLLLKRLAVAYAHPARRTASPDALPDLDVLPVLIRCREWREHLHRPILTLLKHISDVTGQPGLAGLSDALIPLFKKGRVLLLVDGLDEIHDDAVRTTFVDHLESFLADNKLTRSVVTSREAGFSLVAPSLARFCERWRVAPLNPNAIRALCDHWHLLMTGDSPESQEESKDVADHLIENESLHRLAENPLLLTMLLVVKRGYGRLPPDRVTLYGRAVEVLLDTWNIKGHEPLNPKEAVPQLACVAFELMRAGKQTATEKELLALLEEARERVPQIRLRAKDAPQEFLKRVELRSSLLVEAGRQAEGAGTAPIYQFRHLTFQEYLAAVAAVEGHYMEYQKGDTVLTPLEPYLSAEEWKEVIPMSAVLARKQAETLLAALVESGNELRRKLEANEDFVGKAEWLGYPVKLPTPIARLAQCLIEEAELASETLTIALQLIALFAKGCNSAHDWRALSRGPYGEDLLHQTWLLYVSIQHAEQFPLDVTYARLAAHRGEGFAEIPMLLNSDSKEEIGRGLLTLCGLFVLGHLQSVPHGAPLAAQTRQRSLEIGRHLQSVPHGVPLADVERCVFDDDPAIWSAAAWAWTLIELEESRGQPSPAILDRLLSLWLSSFDKVRNTAAFALSSQLGRFGRSRSAWTPTLTNDQTQQVQHAFVTSNDSNYNQLAACMVAFYSRTVWSEDELARHLLEVSQSFVFPDRPNAIYVVLEQMGEVGRKYLKELAKRQRLDPQ